MSATANSSASATAPPQQEAATLGPAAAQALDKPTPLSNNSEVTAAPRSNSAGPGASVPPTKTAEDTAAKPNEIIDAAPPKEIRSPERPDKFCTNCGERIDIKAVICPKCGVPQPTAQPGALSGFSRRQKIGFAAAFALLVGNFLPLASGPFGISVTYTKGGGDGWFVVVLALLSAIPLLTRRYLWLCLTSALALGIMTIDLADFQQRLGGSGLISLEWGWVVLYVGAIGLFVTPFIREPANAK